MVKRLCVKSIDNAIQDWENNPKDDVHISSINLFK